MQRILALDRATRHNDRTSQPVMRSLAADDYGTSSEQAVWLRRFPILPPGWMTASRSSPGLDECFPILPPGWRVPLFRRVVWAGVIRVTQVACVTSRATMPAAPDCGGCDIVCKRLRRM